MSWAFVFLQVPHTLFKRLFKVFAIGILGKKNTPWVYQGSQEQGKSRRRVKGSTENRELQWLFSFSCGAKPQFLLLPFLILLHQLGMKRIRRICSVSEGV